MKTLKVLSIFAVLFISLTNLSYAQGDLTEAQKEEMKAVAQEYLSTLNMSDEQKEEFQTISLKYAEQMLELKNSSGPKMTKIKQAKSIKASKDAELKTLLDAEQYSTYSAFKDELAARQKEILNQ